MTIEARLMRAVEAGGLVDWLLRQPEVGEALPTDPVSDAIARDHLRSIRDRLEEVLQIEVTNPEVGLATDLTLQELRDKDFATQTTLGEVLARLGEIFGAVDGLETTAGSIEVATGSLAGKDFATDARLETVRDLLETIRDSILRRSDPLPAGSNVLGFVSPTTVLKVMQQKVFRSGAKVSTSVASPNASLTLTNPADSGHVAYLVQFAVYADAAADIAFYTDAVSTGTLMAAENMYIGSVNPSRLQVRAGSSVITGGREWAVKARVNTNAPVIRDVFVPIPPGRAISVRFLGPGATNVVAFNGTWYEEAI